MNYDEWAAIGHSNGWLGVRRNDGATSTGGAKAIVVRAGSQRQLLLAQYDEEPMTDEEAGNASGLSMLPKCCYWKRCSELRQAGYIRLTGETRISSAGVEQQVCMITIEGMKAVVGLV